MSSDVQLCRPAVLPFTPSPRLTGGDLVAPEKAAGRGACALCPPVNRCSQALRAEEQGRDRLCTAVVACPEGLPGAGPGPGPQRIRSHLGLSARSSRPSVLKTDFPLTTRHCGRQKGMTEEAQGFHLGFGGSY